LNSSLIDPRAKNCWVVSKYLRSPIKDKHDIAGVPNGRIAGDADVAVMQLARAS
jgi:hypothetical protein